MGGYCSDRDIFGQSYHTLQFVLTVEQKVENLMLFVCHGRR